MVGPQAPRRPGHSPFVHPDKGRRTINVSILEHLYFLRYEVENHCTLAEVYVTDANEATAQRLLDRSGYRKTLLEKVELAVAVYVQRRKIDGRAFQQSKSLEQLARRLDQLGSACTDLTLIEALQTAPEKHCKPYGKLIRRIGKSLALVIINPDDANTRQGLKLGRRAAKLRAALHQLRSNAGTAATGSEPGQILDFQINRMVHLLSDIADTLLAANFGPAVRLQNYKQLKTAAHAFADNNGSFGVERLALTRSGSTIAALKAENHASSEVMAVYKEAQTEKVLEEISGVDEWNRVYPRVAPSVISHHIEHGQELGSMVIEHLPGKTLESLLLNSQWDTARSLVDRLGKTLRKIWKSSWTRERARPGYMQQLARRMPETRKAHPDLFAPRQSLCGYIHPDFPALMRQAEEVETQVNAGFCVLIHGDFNVDNLIYDELKDRIYFIDLHRACYSDYVQDISVLMVSIYRLPLMDSTARAQMTYLISQIYRFSRRFARASKDDNFDLRLAIALARSFATSTRFIYDSGFARRLALRARYLLETISLTDPNKHQKYRLPLEDIFSD